LCGRFGYNVAVKPAFFACAIALLLSGASGAAPGDDVESAAARFSQVHAFRRRLSAAPREVELGRRLFFDAALSSNAQTSCASCHVPSRGYSDGRATALGSGGKTLSRRTPSLLAAGYYAELFWDGRAATIEAASLASLQDPGQMGQPLAPLVERLSSDPGYAREFAAVYPGIGVSSETIGRALGSFVLSLTPPENSPFDRFLKDRTGLSPGARRGLLVFAGKGRCVECHSSAHLAHARRYYNIGLAPGAVADPGRYLVEPSPEIWGAFRVPSLRNAARFPPYMHDGRFAALEDVVAFYDRGGDATRYQDPAVAPLHLTRGEKDDLLAFLRSLTSKADPP
jgi:cytochrome c peroxidase